VLVLAGDHIYKMDYGPMIASHVDKGADITIGVVQVPVTEAREFGILSVTEENRVSRFDEKPASPNPLPGNPNVALASMGIYVFRGLAQLLYDDAHDESSDHDFGKNIIPSAIEKLHVFAYPFTDVKTRAQSYWRDVGTVDAYYDANMELVHVTPELNLYDEEWPIWTYQRHLPPAKFVLDEDGRRGIAINSMVSDGCILSGARIEQSLLFSNVNVSEHSNVFRSVMLPNVTIGADCTIRNAVLDEGCVVPTGMRIGVDHAADSQRFHVTGNGVALVTTDMLRGARAHAGAQGGL
jgi:glucose-1-phosphate adenylyltransferase